MERHCDYIYYNPVRHGLVACPHAWAHSTFERAVDDGFYSRDWLCVCNRVLLTAPDFDDIATTAME